MTAPNSLLIVRTSAMGDIIHALPAVGAIRAAWSETKIGWVVEERWVELLCAPSASLVGGRSQGRPLVDRIHVVSTKTWRHSLFSPDTWKQIYGSTADLREPHYHTAIDFQGSLRSATIARLSGAKQVYGFTHPRERGAQFLYTHREEITGTHIIEQNISLTERLVGQPVADSNAELPRDAGAEQNCDRYLKENRIKKFIILNPGAGWGAKQWPAERYGGLAKRLSEGGVASLINYGPSEEGLAKAAEASSEGQAKTKQLTLTELIAFTRRAALFIGGDTGPMHLAAAIGVPVVALFGPTDPARNGPFKASAVVLRSALSVTSNKRRTQPDQGLLAIKVEDVVVAARSLMRGTLA